MECGAILLTLENIPSATRHRNAYGGFLMQGFRKNIFKTFCEETNSQGFNLL
jgi:hypothetical protein